VLTSREADGDWRKKELLQYLEKNGALGVLEWLGWPGLWLWVQLKAVGGELYGWLGKNLPS
jgi:hypothetical protein